MKVTKSMADRSKRRGAKVTKKQQQPRPPAAAAPIPAPEVDAKASKSTELPRIAALEASIAELRQSLTDVNTAHEQRFQELTGLFTALAEGKPMRLKPIRDMTRGSETYLLVTHYDFVPVKYSRLDS